MAKITMSSAQAIEYLDRFPQAGVWRDYEDCWITPDVNDGQMRHATISRQTLDALCSANVIGNNVYAGHKVYRRVYGVVAVSERSTFVRDEKSPWTLLDEVAASLEHRRR